MFSQANETRRISQSERAYHLNYFIILNEAKFTNNKRKTKINIILNISTNFAGFKARFKGIFDYLITHNAPDILIY